MILVSNDRGYAVHSKSYPSTNRGFLGLAIMAMILAVMMYTSLGM